MSTYRISQLAERSGVPATTLRFYESAGLLPAGRTPAGYRTYDDGAVQRLAFISSAKVLGLALEDIGDLLAAWETGVCAAVRARLLPLVDERIADVDRRIAELEAFSLSLHQARTQLSGPAPAGGCGPDCGCVTTSASTASTTSAASAASAAATPASRSTAVPVTLSASRDAADALEEGWRHEPVACTLTGDEIGGRVRQWRELLARCQARERIPDGLRLTFPSAAELAGNIAALAAAEQQCCSFFDFSLQLSSSSLVLTARAPQSAANLLAELLGVAP